MSIKIISNWSNCGGSTTSFINLTNEFNKRDIECCFYGPHDWHLDKCNAKKQSEFNYNKNDVIITHFIKHENRYDCKKFILSCHETELYPLKKINYKIFDNIHFVSENQYKWHNINVKHFILPNIHESILTLSHKKPKVKVGGIIGNINPNKNIDISIDKALEDNCEYILIFGKITDKKYWNDIIKKKIDELIIKNVKIMFMNYQNDKQIMYDCLTDVYNYSKSETWSYIEGECKITGTNYHSDLISNYTFMETDTIINTWRNILNV